MPIPSSVVVAPPPDLDLLIVERLTPTIILTDFTGESIVLGQVGPYALQPAAQGLGLPPVSLFSDALPDDDGSQLRGVRFGEREVFLPVMLFADDYATLRDLRRDLERLVDPKRGNCNITVVQPDGSRRAADARYTTGMEGDYGLDRFGVHWQSLGLTLRCLDPYWYGDTITRTFSKADASPKAFLAGPFLPIKLTSSQVIGDATIDNPGDADAFGIWVATGPGDNFGAANVTTGKSFTVIGPLAGGDQIIVDTRRTVQTVADQDGLNLWASLDTDSALWPLVPGVQNVTLEMVSATTDSLVTLTFQPRYRSAL